MENFDYDEIKDFVDFVSELNAESEVVKDNLLAMATPELSVEDWQLRFLAWE